MPRWAIPIETCFASEVHRNERETFCESLPGVALNALGTNRAKKQLLAGKANKRPFNPKKTPIALKSAPIELSTHPQCTKQ
jgi:hypothetical protein